MKPAVFTHCNVCGRELKGKGELACGACVVCMSETIDDVEEDNTCDVCGGEGVVLVCIDDICRGIGECIHGDGYRTCRACKGKGYI